MTKQKAERSAAADASAASSIVSTIAGIQVVTIPLAEYAELLDCRRRVGVQSDAARRLAVPPRSPIEKDAEVAAFFIERLGQADMLTILTECRKRFGSERTPSRTAAYDFWQRMRRQAKGEA